MSEDAVIAATQNQSADAHPDSREPPRAGGSGSALQIETIEVLNTIISDFTAQCTLMPDTCHLLITALNKNPSLSAEQHAETYCMYSVGGILVHCMIHLQVPGPRVQALISTILSEEG